MKNGNGPIAPVILRQTSETTFKIATEKDMKEGQFLRSCIGLTKRELFAAMAMQGYMANYYNRHQNPEHVAEYAVKCADALLIELEK